MAGVANGSGITIAALKHNPGPACDGHEVPLLPLAPLGTRWHVAESDACGGQTSLTRESTRVIAGSPWRPEHPNRSPGRVPHPSSGAARRVSDCARPNGSPRRSGRQCATAARSCPPARPGQPRPVRAEGQGPDQTRMGSRATGRRSIARPPISAIRPSKVGARLSDPRASSVLRGKLASDTARAALALAARSLALARASCALASRRAMVARVVCASACLRLAATRRPVAEMAPLRRRLPGSMRGAIAPTEIRRRLRAHGLIALGLGSLLLAAVLLLIWVFKLFNHDSGIRDGAGIGRKCSLLARGPGFRCGVGQVVAGGSRSTAHL